MITGRQIRAARALIDMSQSELAAATGLTAQGIRKIESGEVTPREGTVADITSVLHKRGIEFTDNQGVRFRPEGIDILNGPSGLEQFFDHVYDFLKNNGGDVCVYGVDEAQFARHHGQEHAQKHMDRMGSLVATRNDIKFKVLLKEGDTNFLANDYCAYKWLPQASFEPTAFYVFGDRLALITFQSEPSPKIMLIRSEVFSQAYKKQFEITWASALFPRK